jgi:hypothetical protein
VNEPVLAEIPIESWDGPFDAALRERARAALESGQVLYFPKLPFLLLDAEKEFLSPALSDGRAKNISLDHATGKLQGLNLASEKQPLLAVMIERFGRSATRLVSELVGYHDVERARTSYRPVEVMGRSYSPRSDDRLLHVDAFPSRPMQGRRILRFFSNIAPEQDRRWEVGEPFERFAARFLGRAQRAPPGQSWLFEKLGVTHGRRSAYDELMLSLHDTCKFDSDYQKNGPHTPVAFPPGSSWMVFTDQVLHAALGGAFALEQTFHFDINVMADPSRAPIKVLERLRGETLA